MSYVFYNLCQEIYYFTSNICLYKVEIVKKYKIAQAKLRDFSCKLNLIMFVLIESIIITHITKNALLLMFIQHCVHYFDCQLSNSTPPS